MDSVIQVIIVTLFMFLMGSFVILFIIIHKKRQASYLKEKQFLQATFQQELLKTQIEIQEQTLKNISQEIHDNIGQVLSLAKLNLATFPRSEDEAVNEKVDNTRQLVSKAIIDMRDLSRSMHGDRVAELGLRNAIENELNIIGNTGQYQTEMIVTGDHYPLDKQNEMVLFRIVQEALNNCIKHAKTKRIILELNYQPDHFSIVIEDEGTGFELNELEDSKKGIGLKNMQNRAAMINGTFSLNSSTEKGTSIRIDIPFRVRPEQL
jgi:two-component system, NarL family, sensor kinase